VNTTDKLIGQNIRANRLARGLTQETLAGKIGVTFQQVQKYENGSNGARGSRLVQIAKALDVPAGRCLKVWKSSAERRL
jgi:transcriptional regulator with XRE-family HTH domain